MTCRRRGCQSEPVTLCRRGQRRAACWRFRVKLHGATESSTHSWRAQRDELRERSATVFSYGVGRPPAAWLEKLQVSTPAG